MNRSSAASYGLSGPAPKRRQDTTQELLNVLEGTKW